MKTITELYFTFGGFNANNFSLTVINNKAIYFGSHFPVSMKSPHEKSLNQIDLENLSNKLNSLNIKEWKKKYFNQNILDGIQWELKIKYSDESKFESCGSNEYPNSNGNKLSNDFLQLMDILKEAISEPDFFKSKFIK